MNTKNVNSNFLKISPAMVMVIKVIVMIIFIMYLSLCPNQTLDDGLQVIQLETAVGAAMKNFENAKGKKIRLKHFKIKTVERIAKCFCQS